MGWKPNLWKWKEFLEMERWVEGIQHRDGKEQLQSRGFAQGWRLWKVWRYRFNRFIVGFLQGGIGISALKGQIDQSQEWQVVEGHFWMNPDINCFRGSALQGICHVKTTIITGEWNPCPLTGLRVAPRIQFLHPSALSRYECASHLINNAFHFFYQPRKQQYSPNLSIILLIR